MKLPYMDNNGDRNNFVMEVHGIETPLFTADLSVRVLETPLFSVEVGGIHTRNPLVQC